MGSLLELEEIVLNLKLHSQTHYDGSQKGSLNLPNWSAFEMISALPLPGHLQTYILIFQVKT